MARGPDQRELRKDYEPGRTNIQIAQSLQRFLHTYNVGVNAMLKGKSKRTISPEGYDNKSGYRRDNKTYLGVQ